MLASILAIAMNQQMFCMYLSQVDYEMRTNCTNQCTYSKFFFSSKSEKVINILQFILNYILIRLGIGEGAIVIFKQVSHTIR